MNTLHTYTGIFLVLTLVATFSVDAQTASTTDYDFLLSISEPARFDLYDRSIPKKGRNVVPVAAPVQAEIDFSHPLPPLVEEGIETKQLSITEHLQLATAYRLRGDYVQAVPHYAQVVRLSKQPIHAYFYGQALRATGQDLLADLYDARYEDGVGGALESQPLSDAERTGIPAAIHGKVTNLEYGNAVPNVEVRLVNICTEEELVTTTEGDGTYRFEEHPADCAFVLRFRKQFFEVVIVESIAPRREERVDIEISAVQDLSFR